VGNSCIVKDCSAVGNNVGILTSSGCSVIDCVAANNAVGGGEGIVVGPSSMVRGSLAENNQFGGIYFGSSSYILDNISVSNTSESSEELDSISGGDSNSVVIHNTVGSTNHFYRGDATVNVVGTLENPSTVNTNKDPHANFGP
jgi:hypothetical protein